MPRLRALFQIRVVVYWPLVSYLSNLRGPGPTRVHFNIPTQVDFSGSNQWAGIFCKNYVKSFGISEKNSNFASGKGKKPQRTGPVPGKEQSNEKVIKKRHQGH